MAKRNNLNLLLCIFSVSLFVVGESQKWGEWSEFSMCQGNCGRGLRVRSRLCVEDPGFDNYMYDNDDNDEDVAECVVGQVYEIQDECDLPPCPVDGGWGNWSEKWSKCESSNCSSKVGYMYTHRSCTNPVPQAGGKMCQGPLLKVRKCKAPTNCPIDGGWSKFSPWECNIVYGQYIAERNRTCTKPEPKYGGQPCDDLYATDSIQRNDEINLYDKDDVCGEFVKRFPPQDDAVNPNLNENPDLEENPDEQPEDDLVGLDYRDY